MRKIRVLIVEDSKVIRQFLEHIIARDPRLEIVGAVESGEEALQIFDRISPDVISMDIRLPGMNGLELTERIMRERPTPVVVVAASVEARDLDIAMNALRAGALSVLEKPAGMGSDGYEVLAERLCTQLAIMSQVKLVRRRVASKPAASSKCATVVSPSAWRVLGVVSSTGGPNALVTFLNGLSSDFPLPILLVQHIACSFLEGFADWLRSVSPFAVEIVRRRTAMTPGKLYVAAPDHHLYADSGFVRVDRGTPVSAQRPSGTVLFEALAASFGNQAIGIILTGMGDDGAEGLLRLRQSGGYTIAEDESTAVVYGMPAEAVRLGAACESLPLPAIAPRILELMTPRREVA